jgi:hypothetical protein
MVQKNLQPDRALSKNPASKKAGFCVLQDYAGKLSLCTSRSYPVLPLNTDSNAGFQGLTNAVYAIK